MPAATYMLMVYFSCAGGRCGSPQNVALCLAPQLHNLVVRCDGKNLTDHGRPQGFPSLAACTEAGKSMLNPAANPTRTAVNFRCIRR
jgi:hypothetical protein